MLANINAFPCISNLDYNKTTESKTVTKLILRPSEIAFKFEIIKLSLLCSLFFALSTVLFLYLLHIHLSPVLRIIIITTMSLVILVFAYLIKVGANARRLCRRYEITQEQVITYDGITSCKQYISNLKGMIGMELTETFLGKRFNYGTIILKFLGGSEVVISNIDFPERYIPKITEIVSKGITALDVEE